MTAPRPPGQHPGMSRSIVTEAPFRAGAVVLLLLAGPATASGQQAGWHYSHLPGEGDRASLGCSRDTTPEDFTCLAVRCEDDFSTGLHIHTSRRPVAGTWEMTLDRETRQLQAHAGDGPYGAQMQDPDGWLLDGLRHGTFVYLRHLDDADTEFDFIDLTGSYRAISEALYWCSPRVPDAEQFALPDVEHQTGEGEQK